MRKVILLAFILSACGEAPVEETSMVAPEAFIEDTGYVSTDDSVMSKVTDLVSSTENAGKKITEIKTLKQENKVLKQELVETKSELKELKAALADTAVQSPAKKVGFIKRVINTIKKDTL